MDVADLLELECALERRRVGVTASDEHEAARVDVAPGEGVGRRRRVVDRALGGRRQGVQRRGQLSLQLCAETAADLGDRCGQDHEGRHLGDERLAGRDRDLRTGLEEDDGGGLAGDRRAHRVGDRDDRTALLPGVAGRGDRIGGLTGLGHGDDEGPPVKRRRAVAELRAHRGPGRQPGPVLDRGGTDEGRVMGAAARHELDALSARQGLRQAVELLDVDVAVATHPPEDRLAERLRLLVDLLEHEMLVTALLGGLRRPRDQRLGALAADAVDTGDLDARRPDVGTLALLEEDDPPGVREDRGNVARDEGFLPIQPDDERDVLASANEPADLALVHDDEGIRTLELAEGRTHGIREIALIGLLDEVRDRLRVGLGRQRVTARLEPIAQLAEVLDDAVVDHRDIAGAVLMGMGVQVVRSTMGRPTGVGEPDRGVRRAIGDRRLEVGELAGLLLDEQVAGLIDEGDASRIVATVFEPLEPLDQDRARFSWSRVADDAAHLSVSPLSRPARQRPPHSRELWWRRCAPVRQFSRSPARVAIASASSVTRSASGPSTITLRAGSVPDGRTSTRPVSPSRRSASRIDRWSAGSPSHWSLWRALTARCCCGRRWTWAARSARERPVRVMTRRTSSAVTTPSPVVVCSRMITWPLFSPPRPAPLTCMPSRMYLSPTGVRMTWPPADSTTAWRPPLDRTDTTRAPHGRTPRSSLSRARIPRTW